MSYVQNSGTSATNNRVSAAGSSGMTAINLLPDGSFEHDTTSWINASAGTSGQVNAAVRDTANGMEPHNGDYGIKLYFNHNATATDVSGMYHSGISLTKGKTYVISAYFKAEEALEWGNSSALKITVKRSTSTTTTSSTVLSQKPNPEINDGWQRVSLPYTPTVTGTYQIGFLLNGCSGNRLAFIDDVQIEEAEAPSTYNLVQNGSFESGLDYWTCGNSYITTTTASGSGFGSTAVRSQALANSSTRLYQAIPLNVPADTTFLLSGWARAISAPRCSSAFLNGNRYFGLALRIDYSDGSSEYHSAPFEDTCRRTWQCAVKTIVPKKAGQNLTITRVLVYCAYDNNYNYAYFDNISLRMEPVQTYDYDDDGNLKASAQTGIDGVQAEYDGADLKEYTASNGVTYNYTYYDTHALKTASVDGLTATYTYNTRGNTTQVRQTSASGSSYLQSNYTPSADGNYTNAVTDANGQSATYVYDALTGLLTSETVGSTNSLTTTYTYDASNRAASAAQSDIRILYTYANGQLSAMTRSTDMEGSADSGQVYSYAYTDWGQKSSISVNRVENSGAARTLATYAYYNGYGALKKMTYGSGAAADYVEYFYDTLDRATKIVYNNGKYIEYTYNAEGSIAQIVHGTSTGIIKTLIFEYDSLGRPIRTRELNGDSIVQEVEHLYDTSNRLTAQNWVVNGMDLSERYAYNDPAEAGGAGDGSLSKLTYASGESLNYSYDLLKRLDTVSVKNASNTELFRTEYTYKDLDSDRSTTQVARREVLKANGTLLSGYKYEYDDRGNITAIQEATSTGSYRTLVTYTYDAKGQLLSETWYTYTSGSGEPTEASLTYTYDAAGNILTESDGVTIKRYHYEDPTWADLLTSVSYEAVDNGGTETPDPGDGGDDGGSGGGGVIIIPPQPTQPPVIMSVEPAAIAVEAGTTADLTYDAIGNPLSYYNGAQWTLSWTEGRRLATASTTGKSLSFAYDFEGIRTSKAVTAGGQTATHKYTTESGSIVCEQIYTGSTLTATLYFIYDESGRPVAVPEKIFGLTLILDFFDRCHSLASLASATGGGRLAPPLP